MRLNLSSQIVFNTVPEEFYNPKTAVERSEITRNEHIPTDIYPTARYGNLQIFPSPTEAPAADNTNPTLPEKELLLLFSFFICVLHPN